MQKQETYNDYRERINKVLLYINNHLDENLDLKLLASISNFSIFHFHRILRAHLNESVASYISRIRLETAARLLEFSSETVADIAFKTGYESSAAFNKAFRLRFDLSPTEFRTQSSKSHEIIYFTNSLNETKMLELKPKIKEIKPMKVIYIQLIEKYGGEKMQESWPRLFDFVKKHKLFSFGMSVIGISYDDPAITENEKCRYDACVTVKKDVVPEGEIGFKTVDGGKYAIFKYKGPYEELGNVYNEIYRNWLPKSGYELRDVPGFEKYLNSPGKTKAENLRTHIYVPVA